MKKFIFIFISFVMIILPTQNVSAKESPKVIVLKSTNETKEGFPVYEANGNDKLFMDIYNKSFIKKSIELYGEAQKYSDLKNQDIYLAFKKNSGCYGRIGFYLKKDGKIYDKTKSPYIELSTGQLKKNYDTLESITQILPHEMGHILDINKKILFKIAIKKFFKFIFYVFLALASVLISSSIVIGNKIFNPIIVFLILTFICESITLFTIRKNKINIKNSFISTLMIMTIIIYSLY
ncbi:hypothetical protein NRP93_002107 [Clostridium botulinum]|nr:hypothetical protein [Clostridium botulinum]